jgi:hypothetical protein
VTLVSQRVMCKHPGCQRQGRRHYKLEIRNWHERRLILCAEHGRELGYTPWLPSTSHDAPSGRRA